MEKESITVGDRFRRTVTSGILLTGLAAGVGLTQSESMPEASAAPPTALQFFDHELNRLQSVANEVKSPSNLSTIEMQRWKPAQIEPGILWGGYSENIISKDKTTMVIISYNFQRPISGTTEYRNLEVHLYQGNPKIILPPPNFSDSTIYTFNLVQHDLGKNLSAIKMDGDPVGSGKMGNYINVGKALSSTSSNSSFTTTQMSTMNVLVNQAITVIQDVAAGYTCGKAYVLDGLVQSRLDPPK